MITDENETANFVGKHCSQSSGITEASSGVHSSDDFMRTPDYKPSEYKTPDYKTSDHKTPNFRKYTTPENSTPGFRERYLQENCVSENYSKKLPKPILQTQELFLLDAYDNKRAHADGTLLYNPKVIRNLLATEQILSSKPMADYFKTTQTELQPFMRNMVCQWIQDVTQELSSEREVCSLAISLSDRYLSKTKIAKNQYQLLASACILLASKLKETSPANSYQLCHYTEYSISVKDLVKMEFLVLSVLNWNISEPVPEDYLEYLISTVETKFDATKTDDKIEPDEIKPDEIKPDEIKPDEIKKNEHMKPKTEEIKPERLNAEEMKLESAFSEKSLFSNDEKHFLGIDFQAIVNLITKNFEIWSQYPSSIIAMSAFLIVIQNRRFESADFKTDYYFHVYYSMLEMLGKPDLKIVLRPCFIAMNSLVQAHINIEKNQASEKYQVTVDEVHGTNKRGSNGGQSCSVSPVSTMSEK